MSPFVELNLAALLFAPWFLILGVLYWLYPRKPRPPWRRAFDIGALLLSLVAFVLVLHWGQGWADRGYGRMWQQIVGTSVSYGAFLSVLGFAVWVRHHLLAGQRR
jgi:peptidoglycan biosynthesis protein MviN/MurJ (putative lipid II flippase)